MRFLATLLLAAVLTGAPACSGDSAPSRSGADRPSAPGELVVPHEAAELMEETGTVVLDVRTEAEWDRGHLPGAVRIGVDRLPEVIAAGEFPARADQPIVVYCTVGSRSARAARLLASRGFTDVYDLHGGIRAWSMSGLPVER